MVGVFGASSDRHHAASSYRRACQNALYAVADGRNSVGDSADDLFQEQMDSNFFAHDNSIHIFEYHFVAHGK